MMVTSSLSLQSRQVRVGSSRKRPQNVTGIPLSNWDLVQKRRSVLPNRCTDIFSVVELLLHDGYESFMLMRRPWRSAKKGRKSQERSLRVIVTLMLLAPLRGVASLV